VIKPYYETELGQLYLGDCLEIMPHLPKVDLVLTDPPYEIGAKGCGLAGDRAYLHDITNAMIDNGFDFSTIDAFGHNWFCFCSLRQLVPIMLKAQKNNFMLLTWNKTNPTPLTNNNYLPDAEYIVHSYSKGRLFGGYREKSRFIVSPIVKNDFDHPTVKPVFVILKLIGLGSLVGETILDPFLGSGTTAVACERLNRKWIGIEISEKYCEIAAKRIEAERKQLKLF
jgi:site-specific DNA-methyltransferase (adenine-specific)